MATENSIHVISVEKDFFSTLGSDYETPTGVYIAQTTPEWIKQKELSNFSYVRHDAQATGNFTETFWSISLSGKSNFIWNFSGLGAPSSEIYSKAISDDFAGDIYIPTGWALNTSNRKHSVFTDDNTYQSGIFQDGTADLSYKITGFNVFFNPNDSYYDGEVDQRSIDVYIDSQINKKDTLDIYFGKEDFDVHEKPQFVNTIQNQGNPFKINVGLIEATMRDVDPEFSLNENRRIYIKPHGKKVGYSYKYTNSKKKNLSNFTGSFAPNSVFVDIGNYNKNASAESYAHITGIYRKTSSDGHSKNSGPSYIYENASGALITAKRSCCLYDIDQWELLSLKANKPIKEYVLAASSSQSSDLIPISGTWSLNSPVVNSASELYQGNSITIRCNNEYDCNYKNYRPEGVDRYFSFRVPEPFRRYLKPFPIPDYCDTRSISGFNFTTGTLINNEDYYVMLSAMPLWAEFHARTHRAALANSLRNSSIGSRAFVASATEENYKMSQKYFFTGDRQLLEANPYTKINGAANWTGMDVDLVNSLITGLMHAKLISFNNLESQHTDKNDSRKSVVGYSPASDIIQNQPHLSMDTDGYLYFVHINNKEV